MTLTTNASLSTSGNWNAGSWTITPTSVTGGTFNPSNYDIGYSNGTLAVAQANATILVTPASGLIFNGGPQLTATGTATGVDGENLNSDLTITATHTNAGTYTDSYSFIDPTGNYAPVNGTMTDTIGQATAGITVTPYSVTYDTLSHSVTGTATGLGIDLSSDLTINSTHTNAGSNLDSWSFTDPGGNFAPQSGTMTDTIAQAKVTVDVAPNALGYHTVYGTATPTFVGTVTGQVPAGNPDGLGYSATILSPVDSNSGHLAVGTYTVQAGLTGSNPKTSVIYYPFFQCT